MRVSIKPHKTWEGWYTLDYRPNGAKGERVREHVKGYDEAENRKAAIEGKAPAEVLHPTLDAVVDEYLAWCQKNQARDTYIGKLCRFRQHIIPALGKYRVRELSQRVLDGYGKDMAIGSYRQDVVDLKALIKWMVKRKYADPIQFAPEVPAYSQRIKHLPSPEDIKRFIAAIPEEIHRVMCNFMLYTGLRLNETRHLKWENYKTGEILALQTKTNTPEIIAVPPICAAWFEANKADSGYVFSAKGGKSPMCNLQRPLDNAKRLTGIHMTAHMFRHASATFLYEITGDIYAVQHHLRHSKVTTSQIYTRYSAARRKSSVGLLSDMLDKVDKAQNGN